MLRKIIGIERVPEKEGMGCEGCDLEELAEEEVCPCDIDYCILTKTIIKFIYKDYGYLKSTKKYGKPSCENCLYRPNAIYWFREFCDACEDLSNHCFPTIVTIKGVVI